MICLDAGVYTVKLTLIGDTRSRIDCLVLSTRPTSTVETTWGRIKFLYY